MQPRHPMLSQALALFQAGRNEEAVALLGRLAAQAEPNALFMLGEL